MGVKTMAGKPKIPSNAVEMARNMNNVVHLAEMMKVSMATIYNWRKIDSDFDKAIDETLLGASLSPITPQCLKVLQLTAGDLTLYKVADRLGITYPAAQMSLINCRRYFGKRSTLACVAEAMRRGWVV